MGRDAEPGSTPHLHYQTCIFTLNAQFCPSEITVLYLDTRVKLRLSLCYLAEQRGAAQNVA